jgi:hypothetical protein
MPKTSAAVTKTSEQPEIMFTLEMREKTRGVWRTRSGSWISTVTWTIDLTPDQYVQCLAAVRPPKSKRPLRRTRKVASHAA